MAKKTARAKKNDEPAVVEADESAVIKDEADLKDVDPETKEKYLKRLKKEDKANAEAFKKVDEWLEVNGKKVLRKVRNKAGSVYTFYWFNRKRYPEQGAKLLEKGCLDYGNSTEGNRRTIPLKLVDGHPHKPKK